MGDVSELSLNYERQFPVNGLGFVSARAGIGSNEEFTLCRGRSCPTNNVLTIPIHLTASIGQGPGYPEIGLGSSLIRGDVDDQFFLFPVIGFRFQPDRSKPGVVFRAYSTFNVFQFKAKDLLFFPVGLSLGSNF